MPRRSFQPGRREEYAACLSRVGVGIDSNDVQGIRKLAESAHICQEIQSGPYRGLNQNESAVRVATTIHGYFNYLEEKVDEGELSYNEIHPPELLETLKQKDLYSVGVTETSYAGWKHLAKAEKSYSEIVDMSSIGYRRSDITTDSSMKLYSSFFDQSSEISPVRLSVCFCAELLTYRLQLSLYLLLLPSWNKRTQSGRDFPVIRQNPYEEAPGHARRYPAPTRTCATSTKPVSSSRQHPGESTSGRGRQEVATGKRIISTSSSSTPSDRSQLGLNRSTKTCSLVRTTSLWYSMARAWTLGHRLLSLLPRRREVSIY